MEKMDINVYMRDMCRACLRSNCPVSTRTQKNTNNAHNKYVERLKFCFPDMIFPEYSSYKLCSECADVLDDVYFYKLKLINSQKLYGMLLSKLLPYNTSINDEFKFKNISVVINKSSKPKRTRKRKKPRILCYEEDSEPDIVNNELLHDIKSEPEETVMNEDERIDNFGNEYISSKSNGTMQNVENVIEHQENELKQENITIDEGSWQEFKEENTVNDIENLSSNQSNVIKNENIIINQENSPIEIKDECIDFYTEEVQTVNVSNEGIQSKETDPLEESVLQEYYLIYSSDDDDDDSVEVISALTKLLPVQQKSATLKEAATQNIQQKSATVKQVTAAIQQKPTATKEALSNSQPKLPTAEEDTSTNQQKSFIANLLKKQIAQNTSAEPELNIINLPQSKRVTIDISDDSDSADSPAKRVEASLNCEPVKTCTKPAHAQKTVQPVIGTIRCKPAEQILDIPQKSNGQSTAAAQSNAAKATILNHTLGAPKNRQQPNNQAAVASASSSRQIILNHTLGTKPMNRASPSPSANSAPPTILNSTLGGAKRKRNDYDKLIESVFPNMKQYMSEASSTSTSATQQTSCAKPTNNASAAPAASSTLTKNRSAANKLSESVKTRLESLLRIQSIKWKNDFASVKETRYDGNSPPVRKETEPNSTTNCRLCDNKKLHVKDETPTLYPCEQTQGAFHLYPTVSHKQRHHTCLWIDPTLKTFPIKTCGKVFQCRSNLLTHLVQMHCRLVNEKNSRCRWLGCPARIAFPRNTELMSHVQVHARLQSNDGNDFSKKIKYYLISPSGKPPEKNAPSTSSRTVSQSNNTSSDPLPPRPARNSPCIVQPPKPSTAQKQQPTTAEQSENAGGASWSWGVAAADPPAQKSVVCCGSQTGKFICHFLGCDQCFPTQAAVYEHMKEHEGSETFKTVNAKLYEEHLKAKNSNSTAATNHLQLQTVWIPDTQMYQAYVPQSVASGAASTSGATVAAPFQLTMMPHGGVSVVQNASGQLVGFPVPQTITSVAGGSSAGSSVSSAGVSKNTAPVYIFQPGSCFVNNFPNDTTDLT